MGSGGSSSRSGRVGGRSRARTSVFGREEPLVIESYYRRAKGYSSAYYKDKVLDAKDKGGGEIELSYARADFAPNSGKERTVDVTFKVEHGFANGEPHNINFDNVKSVTGKTFDVKELLKKRGFKWKDGKWVK